MEIYEIIGKIFISILVIILFWAMYWFIFLAHYYFMEEKLSFNINILGIIFGAYIAYQMIWI